jgi:hypothetical protein
MSLSVSGFQGVNTNGTTVPDSAALGPLAVSTATQDSFYVEQNNVLTVTLGNLPPTGLFRITLFGSRDISEARSTRYDVTGLTTETAVLSTSGTGVGLAPRPDANRSGLVVVNNIVPSADGRIRIEVRRNGPSYGYLGALRCEILTPVNFPPSVTNLLLTGSSRVGSTLRTACNFLDPDGDAERQTRFVWERASSPGANGTVISGSVTDASTFTLRPEDQGSYIRCGVTPEASSGFLVGQTQYTPWLGPIKAAGVLTTYHIGNSFTRWTSIPQQLANLSVAEPNPALFGMQLTDGQSLQYHWETGTRTGPGPMIGSRSREEISTGSWDVLVLQPFSQEWLSWSIPGFTDYARRYYKLADAAGTQVYLYAYWPWQSQTLSTQTAINAAFEQVRSTISQSGSKPALIIPSGQALKAVIDACGSGALLGYNRSSFYLDERHPNALGGYVSALTHYATIYKKSPVGLPARTMTPDANAVQVSLPTNVATRIQQIVWGVVSTYPNSGVVAPIEVLPPPPPPPVYVTHSSSGPDPGTLAFAFGSGADGLTPIQGNLPHCVAGPNPQDISIEYSIRPEAEAAGVTWTPEWSANLLQWTAAQPQSTTIVRTGNTVRVSWPKTSEWRFLRIYVVRP